MKVAFALIAIVTSLIIAPIDVAAQKGWKTYKVEDEFSFRYPSNWDLTEKEKENRFTSRDATLNHGEGVITFEHDANISELYEGYTDQELLNKIEETSRSAYEATEFESGTDKYIINNMTTPYMISTFTKANVFGHDHDYAILGMVIKLSATDFVIAQYLSTQDDFDKQLNTVEKILQSVKPIAPTK
jgi:hypothetical protein